MGLQSVSDLVDGSLTRGFSSSDCVATFVTQLLWVTAELIRGNNRGADQGRVYAARSVYG